MEKLPYTPDEIRRHIDGASSPPEREYWEDVEARYQDNDRWDLGWGWRREVMLDIPELISNAENHNGNPPAIPQTIGFLYNGAPIQMSYERALALGLISPDEERWSMPMEDYINENGL